MAAFSFSISQIGPESEIVLRNLFEHYIHDMAEWFEIDTKADGSYSYDTSALWRNGCRAYLAKAGDAMAGFAVVGPALEGSGEAGAHDMREFFVIRRFRRNGCGNRMATLLWNEHPGPWLVRVLASNAPAVLFWRTTISRYAHGTYTEESRAVDGRPWQFFRFVSNGS